MSKRKMFASGKAEQRMRDASGSEYKQKKSKKRKQNRMILLIYCAYFYRLQQVPSTLDKAKLVDF